MPAPLQQKLGSSSFRPVCPRWSVVLIIKFYCITQMLLECSTCSSRIILKEDLELELL